MRFLLQKQVDNLLFTWQTTGQKKLDLTNWVCSNGDLDLLLIYSGVDTHTEI